MVTLDISMPDGMMAFVETGVSWGGYQSASDYLRDLIRHGREETEPLLIADLESGPVQPRDMAALRKCAQVLISNDKTL